MPSDPTNNTDRSPYDYGQGRGVPKVFEACEPFKSHPAPLFLTRWWFHACLPGMIIAGQMDLLGRAPWETTIL